MNANPLPLRYQAEADSSRIREVALFVETDEGKIQYVCRGTAHEAVPVARRGFRPLNPGPITAPPGRCFFMLDVCSWMNGEPSRDMPDLCWGGDRLTADEFLTWYRSAAAL